MITIINNLRSVVTPYGVVWFLVLVLFLFSHSTKASMSHLAQPPAHSMSDSLQVNHPFKYLRVSGSEIQALALRLEILGYKVVKVLDNHQSLEVIVDDKQFGQLIKAQGLSIDILAETDCLDKYGLIMEVQ